MQPAASTRRQRVLMLAPSFLADRRHKKIHGAEVFNLLLIEKLIQAGVDVTVGAEPKWKPDLLSHLGHLLGRKVASDHGTLALRYGLHLRKPLPTSLSLLPRLLTAGKHDLLIVGNVARGLLPIIDVLHRTGRVKSIVSIVHQFPRLAFIRAAARYGMQYMAVSNAVAQAILEAGGPPSFVSFGISNPELFFPAPARPWKEHGNVRFGIVGQLDTPFKGGAMALEAWDQLSAEVRARCQLHLCAWKSPPPSAQGRADVVLHPWRAPGEVAALMRTFDVLVVPSTLETFSQVMVQGMLCGLPVLAYKLPVLAEKLDTGGGAIFASSSELALQMAALATNPEQIESMGNRAREVAQQRYIWRVEAFVHRYLQPQ